MNLQLIIAALIGIIPLLMLKCMLDIRKKAGKSLLSVTSIDGFLFKLYSLSYFLGAAYILLFRPGSIIVAATLTCFSLLFYISAKVRQNCIRENGIILLDSIAKLIQWKDIKEFVVHDKKLYLKTSNGYISVDFSKDDIQSIQNVLSEKTNVDINRSYQNIKS